MKLFIVLSLATSALAISFPKIIWIGETIQRIAEFEQSLTGWSKPNPLLNTTFDGFSLLHMAVFLNHGDHIVPLIQKGANVNATLNGIAPLHLASAYFEPYDAARLLIENGADVNGKAKITPLHIAYLTDRHDIVNLLINNGADQNALDKNGKKPKDFENDRDRCEVIYGMDRYRMKMKQHFQQERYNQVIKELGI